LSEEKDAQGIDDKRRLVLDEVCLEVKDKARINLLKLTGLCQCLKFFGNFFETDVGIVRLANPDLLLGQKVEVVEFLLSLSSRGNTELLPG
jgi:hypothetical protein